MSVTTNLSVQYHQQDTDYYCGAACAQMVLQSIGAGLLDQDDLYADNHGHSTLDPGWATGPDGLQWTLNDRRPATFGNYFALFALGSEDSLSRKLCWTIHHYHVAPVALVYGWAHWITIRGYIASAHPTDSGDNSYAIEAFDVNNPWPPTPSADTPALAPPPPHTASDGCGTGGDRGVANEHVTYATWQSTYMTGVPGGYWSGKFVAVCDPEPAAAPGGARHAAPQRAADGRELLTAARAAALASSGIDRYGLRDRSDWKQGLRQTTASEPLLVQRLDRLDSFYYLVPIVRKKDPTAFVCIDARFGDYQQAVLVPDGHAERKRLSAKDALKRIVDRRIDLGGERGRLRVRKEVLCPCPHLVWRPCRESLSPYYPFYMFSIGAHRLYVRIDGEVFTSLTLNLKGI